MPDAKKKRRQTTKECWLLTGLAVGRSGWLLAACCWLLVAVAGSGAGSGCWLPGCFWLRLLVAATTTTITTTTTATCRATHSLVQQKPTAANTKISTSFALESPHPRPSSFTPTSKTAFSAVSTFLLDAKIRDDTNKWPRTKATRGSYVSLLPPPPPADKN